MLILYFVLGAFILGGGTISLTNLAAQKGEATSKKYLKSMS